MNTFILFFIINSSDVKKANKSTHSQIIITSLLSNFYTPMFCNATLYRIVIIIFFLLELIGLCLCAAPGSSFALTGMYQPKRATSTRSFFYTGISTVTCLWQPTQADKQQQCQFTLAMAKNGQEIENQYIINKPLYTHTLQYLNGGITRDVYLHLPGQPDSVAANSATYLRQYGATGHSTVLLTFPVAEKLLRQGCRLSFRSRQLALQDRQFVFTAREFKHIHQK